MISNEARFQITDEEGTRESTFVELSQANSDDEEFVDTLIAIGVGETFRFGGGAFPVTRITRLTR